MSTKAYRAEHFEETRARRMKAASDYAKRYRVENKHKEAAHQKVQSAIKNGSIQKGPCESCSKRSAVAHHDDYSDPLVVRWLCSSCHKKLHLSTVH
jgi:ribosomal protein S27AE